MTSRCTTVVTLLCLGLLAWTAPAGADDLRIGVVDLPRLVHDSPQAAQAKQNMANKFAARQQGLKKKAALLEKEIERLKNHGSTMSDDARTALQADIRDKQRKLQMEQSQYNDDVSQAEQKEFDKMRGDLRNVIDSYAKSHDYDLILGDSVLYAKDKLDVTDAILAQLKKKQ